MFQLAFSSNAFVKFDVCDAIVSIGDCGFRGIELMFDRPHLYPPDMNEQSISRVTSCLADNGMSISNANAFMLRAIDDIWHPSWIEEDAARRRQRLEHTKNSLRLAAKLGAPSISTEPGGPIPDGVSREQAMSWFREGIEGALDVARKADVLLLVEPEPDLLIQTSDEFLAFAREFASHRFFGLNFDIGHFYCAKFEDGTVGEDPAEAFRKLEPFVKHIHLEDIAPTRVHRHLLPGDGAIDLEGVLRTIETSGYEGWVTVELYPYEDNPVETAATALERLRELGADV